MVNSERYARCDQCLPTAACAKAWTVLLGSSIDDLARALTTGLDDSIYVDGYAGTKSGVRTQPGQVVFLTKFQEVVTTATYALSAGLSSCNEGSTATFTFTTNVTSGTFVPYTLSGISAANVSGGSLSDKAVDNPSRVATISITLLNDLLAE